MLLEPVSAIRLVPVPAMMLSVPLENMVSLPDPVKIWLWPSPV